MTQVPLIKGENIGLVICDMQERFRGAIHNFSEIVPTINKIISATTIIGTPAVYITEQNPKALGTTVPEIMEHIPNDQKAVAKTQFSMVDDKFQSWVKENKIERVVIVGIESHVCVLQTTFDCIKREGLNVTVLVDAISSCNKQEIPIAINQMSKAGAQITTSESFIFQMLGDAQHESFKAIAKLIKDTKQSTKSTLESML